MNFFKNYLIFKFIFQWAGKYKGVILAAQIGYNILKNNGSALDAVEAAIRSLEVDPYFNAGKILIFKELSTKLIKKA